MGRIIKARDLRTKPNQIGADAEQAAAMLVTVNAAAARIRTRARDDIIKLALGIARKVIGRTVEIDPSVLDEIYIQAIAAAGDLGAATMHVHPDDRAVTSVDDLASDAGFQVVEDPSVGRSGSRIRADGAEVDATLDGVLAALETAMKGKESD
ncbi:MAG: hypothetical protein GY854_29890 [Deltaproteobacteria bacterium]|nr:hypothetical protein [Deltaproteobacteria bacterium]